jgi:hypothetical protein
MASNVNYMNEVFNWATQPAQNYGKSDFPNYRNH